jgi:hypothetical protein
MNSSRLKSPRPFELDYEGKALLTRETHTDATLRPGPWDNPTDLPSGRLVGSW